MADVISVKEFEKKLAAGDYKSSGSAKKAIARFGGWTDQMKNKARNAVDNHYGNAPAKKTTKKTTKKAPKAAAKAPKKAPRKAAAKPKRAPRTAPLPQQVPPGQIPEPTMGFLPGPMPQPEVPRRHVAVQAVSIAHAVVEDAERMQKLEPGMCLDAILYQAAEVQNRALEVMMEELGDGAVEVTKESIPVKQRKPRAPKAEEKPAAAPAPAPAATKPAPAPAPKADGGNNKHEKPAETPPFKSRVADELRV